MANRNPDIKQRRTFTLSPESLAYLDQQARKRRLNSQSAVLDELLLEKTREQRRAELEANITAYYDSLSDEEVEEQRAWGELAEQTLVLDEEEFAHARSTARGNLVHAAADRSSGKRKAARSHRVSQRPKHSSAG